MSIIKKISERYNEQVFYKNAVLKIFAKYTKKRLCWTLFLNKNAGLQYWNFIKKRLQHRCFPVNIAKFLRTSILRNICERLFERFATWANNIQATGSEEDIFYQLDEKNLPLHDGLDHFVFSMSQAAFALHNKRW